MQRYIILGRFRPPPTEGAWRRNDRQALGRHVMERTLSVPNTRINGVKLTLGRYDAVIDIEAASPDAAFDLATSIQEATHMTMETMAVVSQDNNDPSYPHGPGEEHTPVREPNPTTPVREESTAATSEKPPFETVAEALAAPEPARPRRRDSDIRATSGPEQARETDERTAGGSDP